MAGRPVRSTPWDNLLADLERRWPSCSRQPWPVFPPAPSSCSIVGFAQPPRRSASALCGGRSRSWLWPDRHASAHQLGETSSEKLPAVFAGKRWTPAIVRRPTDGHGLEAFPAHLQRTADAARRRYAAADITHLAAAEGTGARRAGAYYRTLDEPAPPSCRPLSLRAPGSRRRRSAHRAGEASVNDRSRLQATSPAYFPPQRRQALPLM
ncbi:hypothetical protein M8494_09250 [Serratia ureilytica]